MRLIDADALKEKILTTTFTENNMWALNLLIGLIDDIQTDDAWISVKDRLPEKQIPVLVYVPPYSNENEKYTEYVGVAYYTDSAIVGYWAGTDGNVYGAIGIIHDPIYWMPLPEPPRRKN